MPPNFSLVLLFLAFLTISASQIIEKNVHAEVNHVKIKTRKLYRNQSNRDRLHVSLEIDGKQYDIDFEQSDRQVLSRSVPVWLVNSKPGHSPNYTYERVPNSEDLLNGHVYVDNAKKAVAYFHYNYETRKIVYEGLIGENKDLKVIKPLYVFRRIRTRVNNANHVINKPKFQEQKSRAAEGYLDKPLKTLYPKFLVVVDNHLYKKLGSDVKKAMIYIANFWNHVDQKYLEIDSPKIQLLITGILIADDERALNYVYQSRTNSNKGDTADANVMFEKTRLYFHHNFTKDLDFQNYDVAVIMTRLDINPIIGTTMIDKICDNWYNVAIVRDDGLYIGTGTAVHEMAHLLGVHHDEYTEEGECPALTKDGGTSIMSPFHKETGNYFWSKCTKKQLRKFAKKKAAECLATRYRERHYAKDPLYNY